MKTRYAIKALIALGRKSDRNPVLIADLARQENIPKKFLELILLELKTMGFLESKKGKHGGYFLRRETSKIMIGHVVRGIEGPLALLPCVSQTRYERCDCLDEKTCGLRLVFKEVRDATARILDNTSLSDVLARIDQESATPEVMFHI